MPDITLVNKSSIPTPILKKVIALGAKGIGKRIAGPVVVIASEGRYSDSISGCVKGEGKTFMVGVTTNEKRGYHKTKGSWMELIVGHSRGRKENISDPLWLMERVYDLAAHEWRHVYDFQQNAKFSHAAPGGRRPNWGKRPEEKRACNSAAKAKTRLEARPDWQDKIIALAIELEAAQRKD